MDRWEFVIGSGAGLALVAGCLERAEDGRTDTFPDGFVLDLGETVTLYTGRGTDSESELYWGRAREVWNGGADTMTVRDDDGEIVLRRSYP